MKKHTQKIDGGATGKPLALIDRSDDWNDAPRFRAAYMARRYGLRPVYAALVAELAFSSAETWR